MGPTSPWESASREVPGSEGQPTLGSRGNVIREALSPRASSSSQTSFPHAAMYSFLPRAAVAFIESQRTVHVGWKRAAWPELRILPLETSTYERLPDSVEKLEKDIISQAYTVLKKHNLLYRDDDDDDENEIRLEMLQQDNDPTTAKPTIFMTARWSPANNDAFKKAAQDMVDWLIDWSGNVPDQIHVELTALENVKTIYYGAIDDPTLSNAWDSARDLIYNHLQSLGATRGSLTCLALQKYGVNPQIDANPPTVYISMDHDSRETGWLEAAAGVKDVIDKLGWKHVRVHMEHNLNMPCGFDVLRPTDNKDQRMADGIEANKRISEDYSTTVHLGDDLGAACYITRRPDGVMRDSGLGTVGCFVQIKSVSHPEWRTMILTNYHVVRPAFAGFSLERNGSGSNVAAPPKDSDLWYVDVHGYSPDKKDNIKSRIHGLESPSRTKHNFTIVFIEDRIATLKKKAKVWQERFECTNDKQVEKKLQDANSKIAAWEAEKQKKMAFFDQDKQVLGKVFLCPGFLRKAGGRRMDWALITLDRSRSWSNHLPTEEKWTSYYVDDTNHPFETYDSPIKPQSRLMEERSRLGHVYKVGTTTGPTIGMYHYEKQDVKLVEDKHLGDRRSKTSELIIKPGVHTKKFCAKGDSGSAVFDANGGIVGLFFRGHKHKNSYDEGYGMATPIELVFQDIKDFSGQKITDIRIAMP